MLHLAGPGKICLKCGHERTASDPDPDDACPKCAVVYWKAEAAQRDKTIARLDAKAAVRERAEQKAWEREQGAEFQAIREKERGSVLMAHLGYALLAFPIGITLVLAVWLSYWGRRQAEGTWVETHFQWQISTWWRLFGAGILLVGAGYILWIVGFFALRGGAELHELFIYGGYAGLALLVPIGIWFLFRLAKGWACLFRQEEVG
jgi:uncharacterized membrane protein